MNLRTDHVPLVLFSGGLDSTYALVKALREFAVVDTIHCRLDSQDAKADREYLARSAIFDVIRSWSDLHPDGPEMGKLGRTDVQIVPATRHTRATGMMQPISWMYAIASCISDHQPLKEVWIGYVQGDSIIPNLKSLELAWDHLAEACEVDYRHPYRPKLHFPLKHTSKEYILEFLPREFLKHVSWCESQEEGNDCCHCVPCSRMAREALTLKTFRSCLWEESPLKDRLQKLIDSKIPNDPEQTPPPNSRLEKVEELLKELNEPKD